MPKCIKPFFFITLSLIILLLIPRPAYAALNITSNSLDINSADDLLTISASASGLQSNPQYLQAAFTKEGENSNNYFGFTFNNYGEWFQYQPSPSSSDVSSYFYNFTQVGGKWSGDIKTKIDINDPGFKGPGIYILKLLRSTISTSNNISTTASNNTLSINVHVSAPPMPTPTPLPTIAPNPTKTPTIAVPTKLPTASPTKSATISAFPTLISTKSASLSAGPTSVLGTKNKSAVLKKPAPKTLIDSTNDNKLAITTIIGGLFIITCAIIVYFIKKRLKTQEA